MNQHSSCLRCLLFCVTSILLVACNNTEKSTNEVQYNMISLSESATRSVVKDEMTINLMIMEDGRTPAELTKKITEKINRVLKLNPQTEQSVFSISLSGRYSNRLNSKLWREVATLRIVGTDFTKMNELIEQTQDIARIQDISFNISRPTKVKIENELTEEALQRLNDRSKLVAKTMGLSNFRIVNMNIGTQTTQPVDDMMLNKSYDTYNTAELPAAEMATASEEAVPVVAAEKQDLNLSVQAQIQLY